MNPIDLPLIGIAGGIASGKSFITGLLEQKGAAAIRADEAAHDVLKLEEVKTAVRQRWGDAVFAPSGEVDRSRLGKIVFAPPPGGPAELEYLEHLIHPRVGTIIRRHIEELAAQGQVPAIVLDVPLLFESGWNTFCDKILFVDASRAVRQGRAVGRGWTVEEFDRREAAQQSLAEKRRQSDFVIDNSGSPEAAERQVNEFWQSLLASRQSS